MAVDVAFAGKRKNMATELELPKTLNRAWSEAHREEVRAALAAVSDLEKYGSRAIGAYLERLGLPTPAGKPQWSQASVRFFMRKHMPDHPWHTTIRRPQGRPPRGGIMIPLPPQLVARDGAG